MSLGQSQLQRSQMEQYASRKSGKESLGARAPLRMALAWCQNLVHTLTREEVRSTSPTGTMYDRP